MTIEATCIIPVKCIEIDISCVKKWVEEFSQITDFSTVLHPLKKAASDLRAAALTENASTFLKNFGEIYLKLIYLSIFAALQSGNSQDSKECQVQAYFSHGFLATFYFLPAEQLKDFYFFSLPANYRILFLKGVVKSNNDVALELITRLGRQSWFKLIPSKKRVELLQWLIQQGNLGNGAALKIITSLPPEWAGLLPSGRAKNAFLSSLKEGGGKATQKIKDILLP